MSNVKKVADGYRYMKGEKALTEDLDFFITYAKVFAKVTPTDSIAAPANSTWTIEGNATLGTTGVTDDITWAWVSDSGGKIGDVIRLTNTVVTAGGRTHVRLIVIKIVNQLAMIPEVS